MNTDEYCWATLEHKGVEFVFKEHKDYDGGREPDVTFLLKRSLLKSTYPEGLDTDVMQNAVICELNSMVDVHVDLLKRNAWLLEALERLYLNFQQNTGMTNTYKGEDMQSIIKRLKKENKNEKY